MQTKRCSMCKETKPVSEFCKSRSHKDGLYSSCKACKSERDRRYREANKEKVAEGKRRYREANRERQAELSRRHYEANREQIQRRSSKYLREANARSLELAHRHGRPWEDWEDEFVLADNGLTMYQKAVKLGRGYRTTQNRKHKLEHGANA